MQPARLAVPDSAVLDAAFDQASVGMAVGGPDGMLARVNTAFSTMLGYTPDELVDVPWIAITHPEDRESAVGVLRALRSGQTPVVERMKRYLARDGRSVLVRVRSAPLGRTNSPPILVVVESAPEHQDGLWSGPRYRRWVTKTLDPAAVAHSDSRLLQVNDAFCTLLGRSRSALLGHTLDEFLVADEAAPWQAAMRLLPDIGPLRRPARLQRPDGGWAAAEASITDIGDDLMQIVLYDVSHWRALLRDSANTPGTGSASGAPYPA